MPKHAAITPAPVETKVALQAGGGTLGAALSAFIAWLLGVVVWGVPFTAGHATDAMAAVPLPVSGLLTVLLTIGLGAYAGYKAPHTERPDLVESGQTADRAITLAPPIGSDADVYGKGVKVERVAAEPEPPACGH